MPAQSLSDLSDKMREIDIAMLMTRTDGGAIAGRPMSNNGDVEYDGDSYYFTRSDARMVADIEADPTVSLAFQGEDMFMVAVQGMAEIVRDKAAFEDHWNPDLDDWFEDGADTEGLVMIKVSAERVHYWDGEENGEVKL
ncbi:pyridoxamine 5'-phosphate oxidase family protein [Aliihoeflea sp. 40Bstr573]|uniref:pyridoxamine 5'-phosphate oxidase family protein n=1 Tax=Aliihoeflea sp. 40Bstr573 TaxID=2696467 RepID=UPI0020951FD7|nr:pyridoxamine 5'-phosphate oxidase family protein [Aliihoeflea sp. 40Bstr573]MCO6388491.1 pyridoxamine 5'-phosphate oxidase family protein [Aliihoeflea sp. 40Bstr573]